MLVPGIATRWAVAANIPALLASVIVLHFHEGYFLHVAMVNAAPNRAQVAGYEYALRGHHRAVLPGHGRPRLQQRPIAGSRLSSCQSPRARRAGSSLK